MRMQRHHMAGVFGFRSPRAFSLLEVLVVISIFLFLVAMLIPGLSAARERAWRVICKNNLHHWGGAFEFYRQDNNDYLPTEGNYRGNGLKKAGTWYNELPPYLDLPPYRDFRGANVAIEDLPNIHIWICPAKNATGANKSGSGKNQFHYGMNRVLDGQGETDKPSPDTPDFPDLGADPLPSWRFAAEPNTVLLFDIYYNSMHGSPRDVATMYQQGGRARFHGDFANILLLTGAVTDCTTDDLVTNRDFKKGDIVWNHPRLYWGYRPK